ncbi:MAG: CPBP family intramembrane metalloprotease [Desulfobacterales bacterium]|nr:CPBP family intramembrane metalloprotease [Desulfobacterales bacterium]
MAGVIATFLLGVVFGAVYLWRGSLVAPIAIHFLQNAVTVLMATMRGG